MAPPAKAGHNPQGKLPFNIFFMVHKIVHADLVLKFCAFIQQSVIKSELAENLRVLEDGFELDKGDMDAIFSLNRDLRKIVPVAKLKSGEIVLRSGQKRVFFVCLLLLGKIFWLQGEFDGDLYENIVLSRTLQVASEELFREPDYFV